MQGAPTGGRVLLQTTAMRDFTEALSLTETEFPIAAETWVAAQRTVAAYSTSAAEATELLKMLGIHPSQAGEYMPRVGMPTKMFASDVRR